MYNKFDITHDFPSLKPVVLLFWYYDNVYIRDAFKISYKFYFYRQKISRFLIYRFYEADHLTFRENTGKS